ncbi:hypothetical protein ACOSQ2_017085 [Xanthoceras sorbifolium]
MKPDDSGHFDEPRRLWDLQNRIPPPSLSFSVSTLNLVAGPLLLATGPLLASADPLLHWSTGRCLLRPLPPPVVVSSGRCLLRSSSPPVSQSSQAQDDVGGKLYSVSENKRKMSRRTLTPSDYLQLEWNGSSIAAVQPCRRRRRFPCSSFALHFPSPSIAGVSLPPPRSVFPRPPFVVAVFPLPPSLAAVFPRGQKVSRSLSAVFSRNFGSVSKRGQKNNSVKGWFLVVFSLSLS